MGESVSGDNSIIEIYFEKHLSDYQRICYKDLFSYDLLGYWQKLYYSVSFTKK